MIKIESKTREPLSISKLVLNNPMITSADVSMTNSPVHNLATSKFSNDPTSGLSISLSLTKLVYPGS